MQQLEEELNRTWEERNYRQLARVDSKHANELKDLSDDNSRLKTRIEVLEQKVALSV
jgi:hypothetical protein